MDTPYFKCEDCGHEFEKTEFLPDVEDAIVSCPICDGLDIQLVEIPAVRQPGSAS
jgi:Zn finger protein HypA/HybF involved in hydrogenase expression